MKLFRSQEVYQWEGAGVKAQSGILQQKMRFLVVVPSVRQSRSGFVVNMDRLRASFTFPTELHVLDGNAGKAQTLNRAYDALLSLSSAEFYVTLDDDISLPPGWQDALSQAFDVSPRWGALGLFLGEPHRAYMGLSPEARVHSVSGTHFFRADSHLVGCLIAFRREVALTVGKIPSSPQKYQYWEDGWRGSRVRELGHELAYIHDPSCVPELISYDDSPEYMASKAADIEAARVRVGDYLGGGFWSRVRRKIRRDL
jgi:hypothetical protein